MLHAQGDMFAIADLFANSHIAHGVNCRGVMGKGVALQMRKRYPHAFPPYLEACNKHGDSNLSKIQIISIPNSTTSVINCFTQVNLGADARLDSIQTCFDKITANTDGPVIFPLIGAGIGGLTYSQVMSIYSKLDDRFILATL